LENEALRILVGFDDTDVLDADPGTGKLVRWFEDELPAGCSLWAVVRQQLPVLDAIPYTSHNSAACDVIEAGDRSQAAEITQRAVRHIERHFIEGSDPGLCVACADDAALAQLVAFGRRAATEVVSQGDALAAAKGCHLSGHGGTDDGIIGAAAAVGLTAEGWSGRLIEFGGLRALPSPVSVSALERHGMLVLSVDRDGPVPAPTEQVETLGWLRPRLWGGRAVLPVTRNGDGLWKSLGEKRRNRKA
jgi:hypothetical protein